MVRALDWQSCGSRIEPLVDPDVSIDFYIHNVLIYVYQKLLVVLFDLLQNHVESVLR